MSRFYISNLGNLARQSADGTFSPILWPAGVVYLCLAIGIYFLVLPLSETPTKALMMGALFGFCVYGVYEMTNYSLVNGWPAKVVWIDLAWGIALCSGCACLTKLLQMKLG